MVSSIVTDVLKKSDKYPCAVCCCLGLWQCHCHQTVWPRDSSGNACLFPPPSTSLLFYDMKILKFNKLYRYYVALFIYKLTLGKLPNIFPMFVLNSHVHEHGTRQARHYHLPQCRTILMKNHYHFRGHKFGMNLCRTLMLIVRLVHLRIV